MFMQRPPSLFGNVILIGSEWDIEKVGSSREALIEGFYAFTGRTDVRFGKQLTLWKYTQVFRICPNSR